MLQNIHNEDQDVDQYWTQVKEMYANTCEEVLGKTKYGRTEWMSVGTWKLVEEGREI